MREFVLMRLPLKKMWMVSPPQGYGLMAMGEPAFGSATPAGIMTMLRHYDIPLAGKHAVVVGRSPILGKPMAAMLLNANATVTICHSRTVDLMEQVARGRYPGRSRGSA